MITAEDFNKRMSEQKTSFNNLEEQITYQLECVQYAISNKTNIQIMNNVNGKMISFNINQILINRPNENNLESLWALGSAYTSILNNYKQ